MVWVTGTPTYIVGTPRSTLLSWCRSYTTGGIAALDDHCKGSNSAKLSRDQIAYLRAKLRLYTPYSLFGTQAATTDDQSWIFANLRRTLQE